MSIQIIPFESKYNVHFKRLNINWVEKYFFVESKDRELLEDCKKSIIDKGGFVFFAKYNDEIVGCFSFIKVDNRHFELGKMAVDPKFQGLKIGQYMMKFAIDYGKKKKWTKISLYSSTKLDTALHIYEKFGFNYVVLEKDLPYARSDIKMELNLNNQK